MRNIRTMPDKEPEHGAAAQALLDMSAPDLQEQPAATEMPIKVNPKPVQSSSALQTSTDNPRPQTTSVRPRSRPHHGSIPLRLGPAPKPGSLNAILRHHPRTSLYVSPLRWTSDHLRLLNCQFEMRTYREPLGTLGGSSTSPVDFNTSSTLPDGPKRKWALKRLKLLHKATSLENMDHELEQLIFNWGVKSIESIEDVVYFLYGSKVVAKLPTTGMYSLLPGDSEVPCFVHLNMEKVRQLRMRAAGVNPEHNETVPAFHSSRKRYKAIHPSNRFEDPFIAAVLMAMAQQQRASLTRLRLKNAAHNGEPSSTAQLAQSASSAPPPQGKVYKVRALVTSLIDKEIRVYEALTPSEFLDKFSRPSQFFKAPLTISYTRIEYAHHGEELDKLQKFLFG